MEPTHGTPQPVPPAPDTRSVFLSFDDLKSRYGWKKSAVYNRLLRHPSFPPKIGTGWRLDHVVAFEDRIATGEISFDAPNRQSRTPLAPVEDVLATRPTRRRVA